MPTTSHQLLVVYLYRLVLAFTASRGLGTVLVAPLRVRLWRGTYDVVGTRSPQSLFDQAVATYGEGSKAWTGADGAGFSKIYGIPSMLAAARDRRAAP